MAQENLRVLIVGNGGREHAFAWKLSQSPRVDVVYVAPGNGGTGLGTSSKITNVNVKGDDYPGLVAFAQQNQVNLVVPGPEAPLVDGIQGYFQAGRLSHASFVPGLCSHTFAENLDQLAFDASDRPKPPLAWRAPRRSLRTLCSATKFPPPRSETSLTTRQLAVTSTPCPTML